MNVRRRGSPALTRQIPVVSGQEHRSTPAMIRIAITAVTLVDPNQVRITGPCARNRRSKAIRVNARS
jgi:hypothetical protein